MLCLPQTTSKEQRTLEMLHEFETAVWECLKHFNNGIDLGPQLLIKRKKKKKSKNIGNYVCT